MEQLAEKYKQTEVGLIPSEWEVRKLGDLTKVFTKQTGFDYTAYIKPSLVKYREDDTIPFIQNKDFNNKWINFDTDYFIPKAIALNFPKILLDEKSLLVSISGSVGNVGLYDSQELAFIGGAVAILKFKEPYLIDWVMFYLNSNEGQKKLLDNVKAGSHQNLILDDIRKIEIVFPEMKEQTAIATALSDADALISGLEKLIAKKRNIKQGAMQKLLQSDSEVSGGWEVKKLGEVADIFRGGSPRPIESFLTIKPDGINWIKIGDVKKNAKYIESTDEKIINEGLSRSRFVNEGDFLLSNSMSFGRPYIMKISGCIHDGWLVIQNYQNNFDRDFLYYVLGSEAILQQYKAMASGSSVLNLNKEIVKNVLINCPKSVEEQTRIATILSDMDAEITALETKLEKYKKVKLGMMQNLLTGKIRLV